MLSVPMPNMARDLSSGFACDFYYPGMKPESKGFFSCFRLLPWNGTGKKRDFFFDLCLDKRNGERSPHSCELGL